MDRVCCHTHPSLQCLWGLGAKAAHSVQGQALLSSPLCPISCFSSLLHLKTDFFSSDVAPQPQQKKHRSGGDPAQVPSSDWVCPTSPELGCLFLQAVSIWLLVKGKECQVGLCFLFTCFTAYLQSDQDVTFFEACEPMSAEDCWLLWSGFQKLAPQHERLWHLRNEGTCRSMHFQGHRICYAGRVTPTWS